MTALRTRISTPSQVQAGEVFEVKTLISHPMETGYRLDAGGRVIPRDILVSFECLYNDRRVFFAELHPAIAANPYLGFAVRADVSGTLVFRWTDQHGAVTEALRELRVDG